MQRTLYNEDHEAYRETVREFLAREVVPHKDQWDDDRWIPREVFAAAAQAGLYGLQIPEEFGGSGEPDYRYRMVATEEVARANAISFSVTLGLQDDLFLAYLLPPIHHCAED
ncbi:Acyl-CoA dehydrogenases [Nocardioides sp. J9]|uniref:acyl-CoA dehydrogenase family protein n=1 Tax=Nocardioides sp. J9 TaxID=935844 RepID=UPI0011AD5E8C|nr:acyl-CoA dehydrogenase family protein [Nocardioides sp. J9]TWG91686.1 Acyl-CoA dehydrogenases [Nocardioides sp. J9]